MLLQTINLDKKYVLKCSRCGAPVVVPNASKPDEAPSGMRGNRDEAMKTHQIIMNLL